jgi:hypothetical protein
MFHRDSSACERRIASNTFVFDSHPIRIFAIGERAPRYHEHFGSRGTFAPITEGSLSQLSVMRLRSDAQLGCCRAGSSVDGSFFSSNMPMRTQRCTTHDNERSSRSASCWRSFNIVSGKYRLCFRLSVLIQNTSECAKVP